MGKVDGKVAFITGAARGQGRSHAIRLAEEGADIIAVDICRQIATVPYAMGSAGDMDETIELVKATGQRIVALEADVRDEAALQAAHDNGVAQLGPIDIVLANAGIMTASMHETHASWQDVVDVNLTGVFNTVEACIKPMVARGAGGVIILTSSVAGLAGIGGASRGGLGYTAAKHGIVGLMRSYANTYAQYSIRVNSVHPTGVSTPMVVNDALAEFVANTPGAFAQNALPIQRIESIDVSNAIAWLVSDDARYITGVALPIDAGFMTRKG
jgi:SDR family mycofactocin-dependent oxidoreductase